MKTALKAIAIALSCLVFQKVNSQTCTVANPVLSNISYVQGATCTITFDVEFDLTSNGGNKYVGLYVYSGTLPAGFYGAGSDVPLTATVNAATNVLATLEINT